MYISIYNRKNLSNNKPSGSDGVTYETLKATKQTSCHIVKSIFNTCWLNGKVTYIQSLDEMHALKNTAMAG